VDGMASSATRRQFLERAAVVAGAALVVSHVDTAEATPSTGKISREELAEGRLDDRVRVSTDGPSDFYVQHVTLEPGAASGWHTHPGAEVSVVKAGAVTFVDRDRCEPRTYEAGQAFFVPAGATHLARNEGSVPAELYVTFLVDAGVPPRTDAEEPPNCRS